MTEPAPADPGSGATPEFAELAQARYLSLATYRRDGREVRTPVWFAAHGPRLYCFSAGDAGKVKRIRANGRARVALCDLRGRLLGPWLDAQARIVADADRSAEAYRLLRRKYGWQMWLTDLFSRLTGRYRRRAVLEIIPAAAAPGG